MTSPSKESLRGSPADRRSLRGPLRLLSVMRWRLPEGRLLLAMSLLPQNMLFYDRLLPWLIPKNRNQIMPTRMLTLEKPGAHAPSPSRRPWSASRRWVPLPSLMT